MQEQIINFLRKSGEYVSGEEISRALNISRAGIWKHIQELRAEGYDIVAVPHLGYQLVSSPDKLLPREIKFGLGTHILGKKIFSHEVIPSTMNEAFELGLKGAEEGTLVCAESQTKGRGRLGRSWVSPKGKGIYMSVILRPQMNLSEVPKLTLLTAVAVAEAIYKMAGVKVAIKWPNDLLIGSQKLGGIITELSAEIDRIKFVVVGIGVNINTTASQLPPEATSLRIETDKYFSRVEILKEVLRSLEYWYLRVSKEGFDGVLKKWREFSITIGKRVRIADSAGFVEGEALDLAEDGGLLIRKDSGVVVKKMSGDVMQVVR
jgi:BirA family biotin operon repressor/biotin-[acetyl-CoA-carboxylase] ligase